MKEGSSIDDRIIQANYRLKTAQLGLQIERRGNKLNLRGTLPPKPNRDRLRPHQQRIPLGLPTTHAGLKQAEQQAKVIAAQLIQKTFSWNDYQLTETGKALVEMDLHEKIQAFEAHFRAQPQRRGRSASTQTTWDTAYAPYLRKLEAIAQSSRNLSLTEAIYATIRSTSEDSRSRQICCTAMGAIAHFLDVELPIDLKQFWGTYSARSTQARDLPSDEQIIQAFHQIPNPAWRFVYGMMATYGLRNHEVFFSNYDRLRARQPQATIEVSADTKTGSHEVWPFYPEWLDQFNLWEVQLPAIKTDLNHTTLQRVGHQVSCQFRRYDIPFSPYDLRHAWAVRTIHFGLPDTVAARMMGHSVAIHTRTYHRWIARRDQQQAVDAALQRSHLAPPIAIE
jgi:integrase